MRRSPRGTPQLRLHVDAHVDPVWHRCAGQQMPSVALDGGSPLLTGSEDAPIPSLAADSSSGFAGGSPSPAGHGSSTSGISPASLDVSVTGREVALDVPKTMNWPEHSAPFRLEMLTVHLSVLVAWSSGHTEEATVPLMPQAGVQVPVGGSLVEGDRWTPMMITGEKKIQVPFTELSTATARPTSHIMRAVCQHSWQQEVQDPDVEDDDEEGKVGGDVHNEIFTVTGGKSGLAGQEGESFPLCVCIGFGFRMRLNVTATLYLSRIAGASEESHHTLVINSTGTLELRPSIVELRRLTTERILGAAQDDAKRGDNSSALQKWRYVLPTQEKLAKGTKGRENTKLASLLHSMGVSYNAIANGREALSCLRRALAIRQHMHGEEHPDSARTLQAIGVVRVRDGEYHEAFEYFWQALRYYEAFEPDSLDAASTLQAVAGVYGKLGEYSEALECYLRAVSIR